MVLDELVMICLYKTRAGVPVLAHQVVDRLLGRGRHRVHSHLHSALVGLLDAGHRLSWVLLLQRFWRRLCRELIGGHQATNDLRCDLIINCIL